MRRESTSKVVIKLCSCFYTCWYCPASCSFVILKYRNTTNLWWLTVPEQPPPTLYMADHPCTYLNIRPAFWCFWYRSCSALDRDTIPNLWSTGTLTIGILRAVGRRSQLGSGSSAAQQPWDVTMESNDWNTFFVTSAHIATRTRWRLLMLLARTSTDRRSLGLKNQKKVKSYWWVSFVALCNVRVCVSVLSLLLLCIKLRALVSWP